MQMLMCPPAFYGIEYEINPWVNRSRPSRYLLAQEQYCGGEKCNHESQLPRISSQLHALGFSGLRDSSERVYQGWRQRKVPRPSRPLWIVNPQAPALIASCCGQSDIELRSYVLSTRFNRHFCRRACGQVREH
jgi:hypothetical protein